MARSKHSVALFEVIHRDKRFEGISRRSSATKTPSWWFKGGRVEPAPVEAPVATKPVVTKPVATKKESAPTPPREARPPVLPQLIRHGREAWANLAGRIRERMPVIASPVVGIAVAVLVCIAVLLARVIAPSSPTNNVAIGSTELLRQGKVHPDVLKVYDTVASARHDVAVPAANALPAGNSVPASAARQVNLNYALIQSYADEKTANDARDFLNRNGVACTIERGIKNWRKDFYLVVGLDGFIRVSGPDYTAYRKRIEALSAQFSAPPHNLKGFMPTAIKWDKTTP